METDKIIEWKVEGMTCINCATNIGKYLEKQGAKEVDVNFPAKKVSFLDTDQDIDYLEQLKSGIQKLGYSVISGDIEGKIAHRAEFWTIEMKTLVSAVFTLPLFVYHLLMLVGIHFPLMENVYLQLALSIPAMVIGGIHFGKSTFFAFRSGVLNMDILIFIGGFAALVYSVIGLAMSNPDMIFFETAATIYTLVLVGNWLESRAVKQTTSAITALEALQPKKANKLLANGHTQEVDIEALNPGDMVLVNEGDSIPSDGVLISGQLQVDESMISGESIPVNKEKGAEVTGSTLVISGNAKIGITAIGKNTTLSRIIELVNAAQKNKPQIQRLADKISSVFVPVVLSLAIITVLAGYWFFGFSFQQALLNGIAVLVISCPCAMGLATPTAVMVGVGQMAKHGILVKGGFVVELMSKIKNFVFDKTGTLTTGVFGLEKASYPSGAEDEANAVIFQMEQHSTHPIAKSLVKALSPKVSKLVLPYLQIKESKGVGMYATDPKGNHYFLGGQPSENGCQLVVLEKNGELMAALELKDLLKDGVVDTMNYLKNAGKKTFILSGDFEHRVSSLAQQLGVDGYYSERKPDQKLEAIQQLSAIEPTVMIGDGINDAPSLAQANMGISLSGASQAAIQSADLILLNGHLNKLPQAMKISELTLQTIRQNLFWAFAYNIVAIPVAAAGLLNPMFGAMFMAFSDLIVIGNSIRLRFRTNDLP